MLHRSQRCTLSGHPLPMSPLSLHPRSPSFALITEGQRECWPQTGNMGRGAHGVEGGNHHMPATIHLTNRSGAGCDHNSQQQLPTVPDRSLEPGAASAPSLVLLRRLGAPLTSYPLRYVAASMTSHVCGLDHHRRAPAAPAGGQQLRPLRRHRRPESSPGRRQLGPP